MTFSFGVHAAWQRRIRRIGVVVVLLLLLGWLATLALPSLLKAQIETRGSAALGRTLTLGAVELHPWSMAVRLSDLRIASADGQSAQFQVDGVYAALSLQSLLHLAPVVNALRVENPHVQLTRLAAGHYDIDDVLQRLQSGPPQPPSPALPRFSLYNVELRNGSADFSDRAPARAQTHTLRNLNFSLPFLSTLAATQDVLVRPRLAFELNGSRFDTDAQAQPFAPKRPGEASLRIAHLDLAPYLTYLPATLPLRLQRGTLDTTLSFRFAQGPTPELHIAGKLALSKVQLTDQHGVDVLRWDALSAELEDVQPLAQRLQLKSLVLSQPHLQLARDRSGRLNLASLSSPSPKANTPAVASTSSTPAAAVPWHIALERLAVQQAQLHWQDDSVAPAAQLNSSAELELRHLAWPMQPEHAAELQGTLTLARPGAAAAKVATLHIEGKGTDAGGTASATLADLDLGLAGPYLGAYLVPGLRGTLATRLVADWQGDQAKARVQQLTVRDLALTPTPGMPAAGGPLPSLRLLELNDVTVDPQARQLRVGQLAVHSPQLNLLRTPDGQWQFNQWLRPQAQTKPNAAAGNAKPWSMTLANLLLDDGRVKLTDQQPVKPAHLTLSAIRLKAQNLTPQGKRPAPLRFSASVRSGTTEPGNLLFDGKLMWAPLALDGRLEATQLPTQFVAPYLMQNMRIELLRADASFKGQVHYAQTPAGPDVRVHGDAALDDVKANSFQTVSNTGVVADDAETLVRWSHLALPGIDLTLQGSAPMQLQIGEVSLNDFFFHLLIDPQGRLVLQDLTKPPQGLVAAAPVAPPAVASAPAVAASAPGGSAPAAVIEAGPIHLINGQVAFSDRFIKPNYSAALTELNGTVGRMSSRTMSGPASVTPIELHGRAQGSATLDIVGRVNPLADPLQLNIDAKVHDLELSPLSSYAAKYAGYGIERGRLSVDLGYRVTPDGQLTATNHIVLNQLTFGDAVPGAPTSLPVKLVTALLSDRDGIINLDLPINGSLNDPQFSIWPVVWKILGNLVTKAITSPFSLFASHGGSLDADLSKVVFEPGTAQLGAQGRKALDQLSQELQDRPALRLSIVGAASLDAEQSAIRRDQLNTMLLAEKRRTAAADATAVAPVTTQEYPVLLKAVYRRADLRGKPRNLLGFASDVTPAQMEALLLDSIAVSADTARALALQRSVVVRDYLTAKRLPAERLFLGEEKIVAGDDNWIPQAELTIATH